jgi:hypothetical protein
MAEPVGEPADRGDSEAARPAVEPSQIQAANQSLAWALKRLQGRCQAILVREPLIDPVAPLTSDIDLAVVAEVDDLLPERWWPDAVLGPSVPVDLLWIPRETLRQPERFAINGLIVHRVLGSRLVDDSCGEFASFMTELRGICSRADLRAARIEALLRLGELAVREVGVTWDFPALALFWLQMARASCLAARLDGLGRFCPNVYTRPLDYLWPLDAGSKPELALRFVEDLLLAERPGELIPAVRRLHAVVADRFPEPNWPLGMRQSTRSEYRYFRSATELQWRIEVAEELNLRGAPAAAAYLLRFWAYALARIPMVHQRALEGRDVPYLRPERSVRADLQAHCPEALEPLEETLSGGRQISANDVRRCLDSTLHLRQDTLETLQDFGICLSDQGDWVPFNPSDS